MYSQQYNRTFALFKERYKTMDTKETITMEVSYEEQELLLAVRNYCNSFPNGYPQLLEYAQDLFDELTDMPKK